MTDALHRFVLEAESIRGEHLQLDKSCSECLNTHHYPPAVARLLGEFLAAASLLGATLKFDGMLTLQARSQGEVPLIMAECTDQQGLRGIARQAQQAMSEDFKTLLSDGQLVLTITPRQGQRYQGLVSLEGDNLSQCIESYFQQSEQLLTRIWLHCDGERDAGFFLQSLPEANRRNADDEVWQEVTMLADTLRSDEMHELTSEDLLHRLFHDRDVKLYTDKTPHFACQCSEERIANALISLGWEEVEAALAEVEPMEVNCEFCNRHYQFTRQQLAEIFGKGGTKTSH